MLPEHLWGMGNNVTFTVNGTVIGRGHSQEVFASVDTDQVYELGSCEPKPLKYEGTVELKDCQFHPEFFAITGIPFDVTVSKLAPFRKPRSKKKRIQKKFAKKYTITQETYHDCIITNFEEEK